MFNIPKEFKPHYVAEVTGGKISEPTFVSIFSEDLIGFDYLQPTNLIGTTQCIDLENEPCSAQILFFERSLADAQKKITELISTAPAPVIEESQKYSERLDLIEVNQQQTFAELKELRSVIYETKRLLQIWIENSNTKQNEDPFYVSTPLFLCMCVNSLEKICKTCATWHKLVLHFMDSETNK